MSAAQQPSQTQTSAPQPPPPSAPGQSIDIPGLPQGSSADLAAQIQLGQLSQEQLLTLFKNLPSMVTNRTIFPESSKEAAETLSGLARAPGSSFFPDTQLGPPPHAGTVHGLPGVTDPGPSSHPRGPPNLGQLSVLASATSAALRVQQQQQQQQQQALPSSAPHEQQEAEEDGEDGDGGSAGGEAQQQGSAPPSGSRRGRAAAGMSSDAWARQRKDNHKEVERRRRGNINEGINELGRIVPNGSGEKAKGAILSRAVQYIHHLKENEARNIEKWTLEKLLMDQAMGDLQAQLEEMRRLWDEERQARQRAEAELEVLRGGGAAAPAPAPAKQEGEKKEGEAPEGAKDDDDEAARLGKRQRTE